MTYSSMRSSLAQPAGDDTPFGVYRCADPDTCRLRSMLRKLFRGKGEQEWRREYPACQDFTAPLR